MDFKQKSRLAPRFLWDTKAVSQLLSSLRQSPDAAGAEGLFDQAAILKHGNFLQVRAESSPGCPQGEAAVMTESRRFTTLIALCHCQDPFLQDNTFGLFRAVHHSMGFHTRQNEPGFYHRTHSITSIALVKKGTE